MTIYKLDDFDNWQEMKNKVINCDALELLEKLPDNSIDVFIDPPYGIKQNAYRAKSRSKLAKTRNYSDFNWDNETPSVEIFKEIKRVGLSIFVFGGNYMMDKLYEAGLSHDAENFKSSKREDFDYYINKHPDDWVIWDKLNGNCNFRDSEMCWNNQGVNEIIPYLWNGMLQGANIGYKGNHLGNKQLNDKRYHPTQKPRILLNHMVLKYFSKLITIVDCFSGGFSLSVSCQEMGYSFISGELRNDYCMIGEKRLSQVPLLTI